MRGLLRDVPEGVPLDTLLARIRGRRSYLVRGWDRVLLSPDPAHQLPPAPWREGAGGGDGRVWQALQGEYAWVFRRMTEPLRVATAPFFWLAELRTIAVSLRRLAGGGGGDGEHLQGSLLNKRISRVLRDARDAGGAVRNLAPLLAPHIPTGTPLEETLASGGTGAVERALHDIVLARLAVTPLHPAVARFVSLAIDCRNLVGLAKRLRWRSDRPGLLGGGTIPPKRLEELASTGDTVAIARLAARLGGPGQVGDPANLERTVLHAQYRGVIALAREPDGVGEIIAYLWRCRNEARAIGLIARLATVGPDAFDREVAG